MTQGTILIVDDSPFMLHTLTFVLEKAGYATITAKSGEEALAKARTARPRLILLDAVMPNMDGPQVLRALREDPVLKEVRVVMVSGQEEEELMSELPSANGYIAKPFTPGQVLAVVTPLMGE